MIDQQALRRHGFTEHWQGDQFDAGRYTGVALRIVQPSGRAFCAHAVKVPNVAPYRPDLRKVVHLIENLAEWANRMVSRA